MEGADPGLLAVAREKMRTRYLAYRTEQAHLQWIRRYLRFHDQRHPRRACCPRFFADRWLSARSRPAVD
ncbi:MAG: phage integrase N-terminal SAM-like domain-containing protein [Chromatiales bacterium]|jgi:hypothetical protein|nr:phage integrase N-terminal SAM-like domain-containing protein [Chromatiales bacterium]